MGLIIKLMEIAVIVLSLLASLMLIIAGLLKYEVPEVVFPQREPPRKSGK